MQKKQVLTNAIMSVVQIIVISTILFILYRFLLNTIGAEQFGIWSLVLATTAVTQIANLGLSGSVVKFVAKYIAQGKDNKVSLVIQTAVISVALFAGFVLVIGFPIARWILGLVVPFESLAAAITVLPYAFLALWLTMITSLFQAGIDGYQRIDLRSLLLVGGAAFHLLLCIRLAPMYGLQGVAIATVIQNLSVLIGSWIVLRKSLNLLPFLPYQWNKTIFKEIVGYGINFQMISIATIFYDPVTKALLSKFGGLSMVGFYEMANKMIKQFRALIVSANQVLVPPVSDLKERSPEKIQSVYTTSYQLLFYIAFPLYSLIIVSSPLISMLWIGHHERYFVIFVTWLAIGWFLNTIAAPAYFVNLGTGKLRENVTSHVTIGLLNAGLGFFLGSIFHGIGVVIAWVISLVLGSSIIYLSYHIKNKIPLIDLLPKACKMMVITCSIGIAIAHIISHKLNSAFNSILLNSMIISSFSLITFILVWVHPMRKQLKAWIANELLNNR